MRFLIIKTDPPSAGAVRPETVSRPWYWVLIRHDLDPPVTRSTREFASQSEARTDALEFRRVVALADIEKGYRPSSEYPYWE